MSSASRPLRRIQSTPQIISKLKRTNSNQVELVSVAIRPVYHHTRAKCLSGISHTADVGADGSAITFNPGCECSVAGGRDGDGGVMSRAEGQ